MKVGPLDPILLLLAKEAGVRPPHVFHVLYAVRTAKDKFDPEAFAHFASLELRHVTAIVDALTSKGLLDTTQQAPATRSTSPVRAIHLLPDFTPPDNWISWAREKRFWSQADTLEEADIFKSYWLGNGKAHVDWYQVWQNWVRRSKRPNGTHSPAALARSPEQEIEALEAARRLYERMGRVEEIGSLTRQIEALRNRNVVEFRRQG